MATHYAARVAGSGLFIDENEGLRPSLRLCRPAGLNADLSCLAIAYKGFAYTLIHQMDYVRSNKCKYQAGNCEKAIR